MFGYVERLLRHSIAKRVVHGLVRRRVREGQPDSSALRLSALVRDLDRNLDRIALPYKSWRVGLNHQILRRHNLVGNPARPQLWVMSKAEEFPLGQRLRHGEHHLHHTVVARDELREEEGGFI